MRERLRGISCKRQRERKRERQGEREREREREVTIKRAQDPLLRN